MIKSSFFEYNVAKSALFTAQGNLQVTSHNISNAATRGYSRQAAVVNTNRAMAGNGTGMYGTGSSISTVIRYRSAFLDQKYWSQNAVYSQYNTKKTNCEAIENIFTKIDSDGVNNILLNAMTELQNVFSDLSTNANDYTFRNNVLSSAESLSQYLQQAGDALTQQQQLYNEEITISVTQMNSIANQISEINKQILQFEYRGDTANDLRDSREKLVDELSKYINVDVVENDTTYTIFVDGNQLVSGGIVSEIELRDRDDQTPPVKLNPNDAPGMYDIYINGSKMKMYSDSLEGSLKALIDLRDGNNARGLTLPQATNAQGIVHGENEYGEDYYRTTSFKGIPHYIDRLNELVRTYARAINDGENYNGDPIDSVTGHINGFDLEGNTGRLFFSTFDDEGNEITNVNQEIILYDSTGAQIKNTDGTIPKYNDLEALGTTLGIDLKAQLYSNSDWQNITVSSEIKADPGLIATSSTFNAGESGNVSSMGFGGLMDDPSLFASGKMSDFIIGITSEISVSSKQSTKFTENYSDIVAVAENQRISFSGVDLNEESVNMIKYQQMYQAASKLISIIDSIYDTTINRMF